jgi:hypothetical protein
MKKIFFTLGLLIVSYGVFAQDASSTATPGTGTVVAKATEHSKDFLVIQLGYVNFTGTNASSIHTGFNRQFNIALMYDIPIPKSNFSMAAGLGIGSDNYYLKRSSLDLKSGTSLIPDFQYPTDQYKRFKLSQTYLELPVELRYRGVPDNANKGFKAGIGLKVGDLLQAKTRSVQANGVGKLVEKESDKGLFNTWRFAATARVGYGNFAIYGTYSLTKTFKDGSLYSVSPYSVGLQISGL